MNNGIKMPWNADHKIQIRYQQLDLMGDLSLMSTTVDPEDVEIRQAGVFFHDSKNHFIPWERVISMSQNGKKG